MSTPLLASRKFASYERAQYFTRSYTTKMLVFMTDFSTHIQKYQKLKWIFWIKYYNFFNDKIIRFSFYIFYRLLLVAGPLSTNGKF